MSIQPPATDQIRAAWDAIAPRFDAHITPKNLPAGDAILDRWDVGPGLRVLDVACGSGALAIPAARRGADVVGVDISPRMIELLGARARAEGLRVEGRVMDALALELPDDGFDLAVSQNGVTMSPRLGVALAEMARVTRPGGSVVVVAFGPFPRVEFLSTFVAGVRAAVPGFTGLPTDPPPPPFQVADPAVLAAALREAGLGDVSVDTVTWDMPTSSGQDLWDSVLASNPLGGQMVADLTEEQRADAIGVLDGLLRERFGGRPEGVLHAAVNVGSGTV